MLSWGARRKGMARCYKPARGRAAFMDAFNGLPSDASYGLVIDCPLARQARAPYLWPVASRPRRRIHSNRKNTCNWE